MKYKVGDKVRVKEDLKVDEIYGRERFVDNMEHLKGKIVTIEEVMQSAYRIKENDFYWTDEMFEYVENEIKTIEDLQTNDIITLRNGDKLVVDYDKDVVDVLVSEGNILVNLNSFNPDLTCKHNYDYDIVKVERPVGYETAYAREKAKKRMTIAQICKELGYDVEIVEEEEE